MVAAFYCAESWHGFFRASGVGHPVVFRAASFQPVGCCFSGLVVRLVSLWPFCGWLSSVADVGFRRLTVRRGGVSGVACVLV